MLVRSTSDTFAATVVPAAEATTPVEDVAPEAVLSAAKVTEAVSPTFTEPTSDSETEAGTTMFVISASVMKPLLLLVFALEVDVVAVVALAPEADPVLVAAVLDEPLLDDVLDEPLLDDDATEPEPGDDPTPPLTVMTVPAMGDVRVQSATVA